MLKIASPIAVSFFVTGAAPTASYSDCFDGCVLNCVSLGNNVTVCAAECMDVVCLASKTA